MGTVGSSASQVQALPRDQWEEITLSGTADKFLSYGQFKIYRNSVTNEEIQEYRILFQTNQQWERYLKSFSQRLQEEHIVNSRFIDLQHSSDICGCGRYAKVYTERIPLRLHEVSRIDLQECIYVLYGALNGFAKLFGMYGYFKPISSMVGFDCEGRVKVWICQDFSQNSKHCPLQLQKIFLEEDKTFQSEDLLVWQIINLFKGEITHHQFNLFLLECFHGPLTFQEAKQKILEFASHRQIQLKRYFQSLLPLIRQKSLSSKDYFPEFSNYDIQQISFKPIQKKDKVIYYIHPMEKSSEYLSSQQEVSQSIRSNSRCSLDDKMDKRVQILSTGITVASPKHNNPRQRPKQTFSQPEFRPQFILPQSHESQGSEVFVRKRPRIHFNYTPTLNVLHQSQVFLSSNKHTNPIFGLDEGCEPIQREEFIDQDDNRVVYSGTVKDYQLDRDICRDMLWLKRRR